jgi:colicin import membrane protein
LRQEPPPEPPKRPEPPPKPEAEDAPSPPVKPRPQKPQEDLPTPRPPERPRVAKVEEPPKPDKFKPDDIAKALAKERTEEKPRPKPPAFDAKAIDKLIGSQTRTAEAKPSAAAPQGLPTRNSPRMSVSLENGLNEWFRDSYKNCWSVPPTNPSGENYVFDVRVTFNPDGSLAARPVMLNPPHDPEWRAHAESVMRAVQRCNPLHIPTQYAPFFDQWRSKTIHFDPSSAEG